MKQINGKEIEICELYLYGRGYVDGGGFKYSEISEILGFTIRRIGKVLAKERRRFLINPIERASFWLKRGQEWWFDLYLTYRGRDVVDLVKKTEKRLSPMNEIEKVKKEEVRQKYSQIMQNYLTRKERIENIKNLVCFI